MNLVFTRASLNACLQHVRDDKWFESPNAPVDGSWSVLTEDVDNFRFFVHRNDIADSSRIVILASTGNSTAFFAVPESARLTALARLHRAASAAARPPLWLPPEWFAFHEGNLIAFFATTREQGHLRWIMEQIPGGRHDVVFWELTSEENQILLQNYKPNHNLVLPAFAHWADVVGRAKAKFAAIPVPIAPVLSDVIDLGDISYAAVTQHRSYSTWLEHLSAAQADFVSDDSRSSIKVRGPAGTGKTLALEMKLLRELYASRDTGRPVRILFATHSWSVAVQVDEALRELDERGDLTGVDIMPLLAIAQTTLPQERAISGLRLLGEDSLSGKQEQLKHIDEVLEELRSSDWLVFRSKASAQFRARVESEVTAERQALVWDLMSEFSSVLSANGILPGINAERRYFSIARSPWMMPLDPNSSDRAFVLHIYDRYVTLLKKNSEMSSDQLINDFWNYLETFAWNIRREKDGYDIIFADELHLFSQQERLTLNLLTRSPDQYPRMYMALDPRQSPSEVYVGFGSAGRSSDNGEADLELGKYQSVDLKKIYRFTPQILELLRHVNRLYPAVESLGDDWKLDLDVVESGALAGPKPALVRHSTIAEEAASVAEEAKSALGAADGRVAVVTLDPLLIPRFEAALSEAGVPFIVIASRNDVDKLRYRKRGIILSSAEYVAGLQFNTVLCCGFVDSTTGVAHSGHQRRRLLSLLYLAVSRAEFKVIIHVNDQTGGVPDVLGAAFGPDLIVATDESAR